MKIIPCRQKRESMEKLDKERYLKRVIVVCWIALAICFGIKLFGGNLFEIMCNNENFIKVCEYADNNWWAYYLIGGAQCFISLYFFGLAIAQQIKYKKWQLFVLVLTVLVGSAIKMISSLFGLIFDIWQLIGFPTMLLGRNYRKYWRVILANVLLFGFQCASFFIKDIHAYILGDSILIGTIFSIDVWMMLLLYFAHSNISAKKGD